MSKPPLTTPGKLGKRLTPSVKQTIVASVVSGRSQKDVALDAGVSPLTVSKLVHNSVGENWRNTLSRSLSPAAETISLAVRDREDIHKAAADSFKLLTGMGLLNGEQQTTVITILNTVNTQLPADLQFEIISTDEIRDTPPTPES